MFFPGETITNRFVIPFAANEIDKIVVTFHQRDHDILEKTLLYGFIEEDTNVSSIEIQFTQEEGLLFEDDYPYTIQLNVYTKGGTRHTSRILSSTSGVQYLRNVLTPEQLVIVTQPTNCYVNFVGEIASFEVIATGAVRYQWQVSKDGSTWIDVITKTNKSLEIEATSEVINENYYRCKMADLYQNELTTNSVRAILR